MYLTRSSCATRARAHCRGRSSVARRGPQPAALESATIDVADAARALRSTVAPSTWRTRSIHQLLRRWRWWWSCRSLGAARGSRWALSRRRPLALSSQRSSRHRKAWLRLRRPVRARDCPRRRRAHFSHCERAARPSPSWKRRSSTRRASSSFSSGSLGRNNSRRLQSLRSPAAAEFFETSSRRS